MTLVLDLGARHEVLYFDYDTLLQNVTDVITKCDRTLSQNTSGFLTKKNKKNTILLQNATFVAKCDLYYKFRQYNLPHDIKYACALYYKMPI